MFDLAVIGTGIMGAPTAWHAARNGASVAAIGVPEPADFTQHHGLFGAWHDASRLVWQRHAHPAGTEFTARAIEVIRTLETEGSPPILTEVGFLFAAAAGRDEGMLPVPDGLPGVTPLGIAELRQRFGYLALGDNVTGYTEDAPSGYISPRGLVTALLASAQNAGAEVIPEHATGVVVHADHVVVQTSVGRSIKARKAVLATGAFSNTTDFLPRPVALRRKSETALMAEMDLAKNPALRDMPIFVYQLESELIADIYMAPPMVYPGGRTMMKFGANTLHDTYLDDAGIESWYREGDSDSVTPDMRTAFERLFPNVVVDDWHGIRCVITRTPHGRPYIDTLVDGRLYCAIGGNGHSAKWSGAIGGLAASLALSNEWADTVIPPDHHRAQYADEPQTWTTRDLLA
jgi:glycine/D-amino acid oxidase-like deaminating enzyme